MRHTRGIFAKKSNTMCADMNIQHFKQRFICIINASLIQITNEVNMRFFFLSVYFPFSYEFSTEIFKEKDAF